MAACFADYTRIAGRARELLILLYLFLAVSPAVLGTSINGSVSWIYLPLTGGTINLSYVQLITVPVYAAVLYRYRGQGMSAVLKAAAWMIPSVLLMAWRPNIILAGVLLLTYLAVLAAVLLAGLILFLFVRFMRISLRQSIRILRRRERHLPGCSE